ncbi:SURF1 family protein [Nitrobacter sp. JJSN]|uniref:SURF1 family protein n=1 Tax=Nitrobacter sp. JJSN TaxID=3453033 RepID=UPI003F772D23
MTKAKSRGGFGLALFTLIMVALLIGLGVWQLQRRTEKRALIAILSERLAEKPSSLPNQADWAALSPPKDEFRRVSFSATYESRPDAMIYTFGSGVRPDTGLGTWAFLPAQLPGGGTVIVNTGFVQNTMQDRGQQDRAVSPLVTGQPVAMTGYLRFPEKAGLLTPSPARDKRLWFSRDIGAMAQALGWEQVAPFYIDLEAPVPASGVPKPGPLEVHLKDDHLQYAITWFGLAAAVGFTFGAWWRSQRRST